MSFNPTTTGEKTAVSSVVSNDPDQETFTFTLTGTGVYGGNVKVPIFSHSSGTIFNKASEVTITSATEGALIRYTFGDGSQDAPTSETCTEYTGPVTIPNSGTLKAITKLLYGIACEGINNTLVAAGSGGAIRYSINGGAT
ncbi:MAG: hypothetical protein DRP87_19435 [Spirochaetes bacterium]|nr:MAG: hypothetical protein DRP87_19435 [Spirochaetota bacterium]